MPKIESWDNLPAGVRQHLIDRMRDRAISIADLNRLRLWIESKPEVPEGDWYKDFGSFKICGEGSFPKTFLLRGQAAKGQAVYPHISHPSADVAHALVRAVSRLSRHAFAVVTACRGQASARVPTRHARVRAPHRLRRMSVRNGS